jgi:putative transposase
LIKKRFLIYFRYVTKAFLVVVGVREDCYREILGARIADGEDELFWSGLFQDLKDRGLSGVKLVISDGKATDTLERLHAFH